MYKGIYTFALACCISGCAAAAALPTHRQYQQAGLGAVPGATIVIDSGVPGRVFEGVGGLFAIGGARLWYEYPPAVRDDVLDLFFSPAAGGAPYTLLKMEIEGDVDSSYGSGPSYSHTPIISDRSWNRGIYLPWLVQEARKRNPNITLYSLSWGVPAWVGNNSYLSPDGVKYHVDYLTGAREVWNVTFHATGVWNERGWSLAYVKQLRAALDAAGFQSTAIIANDGTDNTNCRDCPGGAFGEASVSNAIKADPAFGAALGLVGMHHGNTEGVFPLPNWEATGRISYWNSENNDLDGPMPQWAPVSGNAYGSGLSWPRVVIVNYLRARATATILCPATHSFTWNYGRHNHGHTQLVEPWSGYYEIGAGFWGQAHITQFVRNGWRFLDGSGAGQWCRSSSDSTCWLVWATWLAPTADAITIVLVNSNTTAQHVSFSLAGGILGTFSGATMAVWTSTVDAYFSPQPAVSWTAAGGLSVTLPARSVTTLSTLKTGMKANRPIPTKAPFPLPFVAAFDDQRLEGPGRFLSDLWGAFEVAANPIPGSATAAAATAHSGGDGTPARLQSREGAIIRGSSAAEDQVLWQAAAAHPKANAWLRGEGIPFTSLPGGSNFANVRVSARVLIMSPAISGQEVHVCGRVPIWQPANFNSDTYALGVCIVLAVGSGGGGTSGTWALQDNTPSSSIVLANGLLSGVFVGAWHTVALAFDDDTVAAAVDGVQVASSVGSRNFAGVAGFGTGWHDNAFFDDISLDGDAHPFTVGSWLHDVLPGDRLLANLTGWAGTVLDLTASNTSSLLITALGRFRARGNSRTHAMDIIRVSDGMSMLGGQGASVDLSAAGCLSSDLLGFCYSQPLSPPVSLPAGAAYYVISEETSGGDAWVEMTNPAAATTHTVRDGSTSLTHAGPGRGHISGRASRIGSARQWRVVTDIDTMFGPVNWVTV